ncbi:MAG: hypothetical protein UY21_C0012G0031 [Microgenomates group bacterium GW2011_GWA1_48_10]|uniref:Nudix hydrolase domain-containing protein n=1 Tax=Candidatus Gottesmanbacteria bacterium RIFCSPHIGHO2_01_FULL_47_48 TaxID=1798381 RepID=A0A1F6A4H5_9BACT|nr:MAG: hypothetical protein UY21_C0012G0031 [Microgenomates group bacterium GW2011_GWA1_48_10]OGG19638.1 MAG: hypothetical protein A2721_00795 [Candidatus Gottesmanbacteria bacterium RIFCSPHIGHO2_01_FULL_47_48]
MVSKVQILQKLALISGDKILVLKRAPGNRSRPNTWDSTGGNVDDEDVKPQNEDILLAALKREVVEEIGVGLTGEKIEIVYIDSGLNSEGNLVIWLGYKCQLKSPPEIKPRSEHSEFKWVSKNEFLKLDFGYAEQSMKEQIERVHYT